MKSSISNLRISPRKLRLVADLIKGKKVSIALAELAALPKRSSAPLAKLINSAAANLTADRQISPDKLTIKDLRVDQGRVLKRMMPRARGRGAQILKRSSHVSVVLGF